MTISFEKATYKHKEAIFQWLHEPHVQEFWDNTPEHKKDIINFMDGRIVPSSYCDGLYTYWVALFQGSPYALIMAIQETAASAIDPLKLVHLSKSGHTYGIDFMIGSKQHLGRGLAAPTLSQFLSFFQEIADPKADTFLIDPAINNPKAQYVYEKAGFDCVGSFTMRGNCSGAGKEHQLLKRYQGPLQP